MKKRKNKIPKERNHLVALAIFRKAGKHRKSNKANRKKEKDMMVRSSEEEQDAFNIEVGISKFPAPTMKVYLSVAEPKKCGSRL